ncbi:MAG: TrmH family RNA methyltransferase, partial [Burkholderiales bacterium]
TAMTPRDFGPPNEAPRAHFDLLLKEELETSSGRAEKPFFLHKADFAVAFLFGSERFGMANEDVYRCHVALTIPTNPAFGSLNLAAAVQVIAYEWRMALGGFAAIDGTPATPPATADARAVAGMLEHWQQALVEVGFLDPAAPKKLMPRLNQIANRARLGPKEIDILRGIAKAVREAAGKQTL